MFSERLRDVLLVVQVLEKASSNNDLNLFFSNETIQTIRRTMVNRAYINHDKESGAWSPFIPITNQRFLEMLYTPVIQWTYLDSQDREFLLENNFADLTLLESHVGLSSSANEWLLEMGSVDELDTKVLEQALHLCRQLVRKRVMSEERATQLYADFRQFPSQSPVIDEKELKEAQTRFKSEPQLGSLLRKLYEEFPYGEYVICPGDNCGWGARLSANGNIQCVNPWCRKFHGANPAPIEKQGKLRTKPGIQYYVSLTAADEKMIENKLNKSGFRTRLYPGIETMGDIEAKKNDSTFYMDVKSYREPRKLAEWLLANEDQFQTGNLIIVIPERIATRKKYIDSLLVHYPYPKTPILLEKDLIGYLQEQLKSDSKEQDYA